MDIFDQEKGVPFTVIYRDKSKIAYAKKILIQKFIRDREYELIKGKAGKIDHLMPGHSNHRLTVKFTPAKRQRVTETEFDLRSVEVIGVTARGSRLASKPVSRILVQRHTAALAAAAEASGSEDGDPEPDSGKPAKPPKPPKDPQDPTDGGGDGEQFSLF